MAHFNLHEQEQLAQVKYFWKDWGRYFIGLILLFVICYAAFSWFNWQQQQKSAVAAQIYAKFTTALTAPPSAKRDAQVFAIADQLIQQVPSTAYASMASLTVAKLAFKQKNYAQACHYLIWVIDSSSDKDLQSIAAIRLAAVYIDEKNFTKAREMLKLKHNLAFDGLFYEGRGDMYIAMGDLAKARDAYKEGLQKAANDPATSQAIQMKLDILGG